MVPGRVNDTTATGPGRLLAAGLLILMGMIWGLQFAMLKLTSQGGYSEISVVMIALVLLSLAFLAISHLRGEHIRSLRGVVPFLLITSVLGYVIPLFAALTAADNNALCEPVSQKHPGVFSNS